MQSCKPSLNLSTLIIEIQNPCFKMHFQLSSVLSIASAAVAVASPALQDASLVQALAPGSHPKRQASTRPTVKYSPKTPTMAPTPAVRTKICTVECAGNGTDDSPAILSALNKCNNGGHVIFSKGVTYNIGTALDLTFLRHIDLGMLACDTHELKSIVLMSYRHSGRTPLLE